MTSTTSKPAPDLTDVALAEAFVTLLDRRDIIWIPEKGRWARVHSVARFDWLAKEQVEALARVVIDGMYRQAVESASTQWSRARTVILKRAARLRSATIISTLVRLAKADQRIQRTYAWLCWDGRDEASENRQGVESQECAR
jgi:hypothetical protein